VPYDIRWPGAVLAKRCPDLPVAFSDHDVLAGDARLGCDDSAAPIFIAAKRTHESVTGFVTPATPHMQPAFPRPDQDAMPNARRDACGP